MKFNKSCFPCGAIKAGLCCMALEMFYLLLPCHKTDILHLCNTIIYFQHIYYHNNKWYDTVSDTG